MRLPIGARTHPSACLPPGQPWLVVLTLHAPLALARSSKCYKETVAKSSTTTASASTAPAQPPSVAPPTPPPPVPAPVPATEPVAAAPAAVAAASPAAPPPVAEAEAPTTSTAQVRPPADAPVEDEPPKKVQVNTSRCWTCNRKIGLTGFQCKCDFFFCAEHRYSDRHECTFDFKTQGKQLLAKANPTIAPAKLETM